jgi:hypothetical protein
MNGCFVLVVALVCLTVASDSSHKLQFDNAKRALLVGACSNLVRRESLIVSIIELLVA